MRRKIIEVTVEVLTILMNHWVFVLVPLTILGILQGVTPYMALWFALGLVPVFFYAVREKVNKFFLFFLLHLMVPAAGAILPISILPKILLLVICVIYIIMSVRIRILEDVSRVEQFHPVFMVAAIGVLSVFFQRFSEREWPGLYEAAILIYLSCYFIRYFLRQYEQFLVFNASSASNLPKRTILYSGMKQTMVFTGGSMVVLLIVANMKSLAQVGRWIKEGLLAILWWIVSFLPNQTDAPEEMVEEVVEATKQESFMDAMPAGEAGKLWVILQEIFLFLVVVGVVAALGYGVVKLARYLWKQFHLSTEASLGTIDGVQDIRENCEIERRRSKGSVLRFFRDNRQKVRKLYRSRMLKNKTQIIGTLSEENLMFMTARECCEKISAGELKNVYEKARYTEGEITAEDLKRARG